MRLESYKAREYYLKESKESNWSVRQLQRNINSKYYERLLSSLPAKTESNNLTVSSKQKVRDFVKDPYVLEFLKLPEDKSLKESSLEQSIIENLKRVSFGDGQRIFICGEPVSNMY